MSSTSTEIATVENAPTVFTDSILAKIDGWDAVAEMFESNGIAVERMSDYGTGFKVTDKDKLIGVPLFLVEWRFNSSSKFLDKSGKPLVFVSVAAVTKSGDKVIFNDGSTGIKDQLVMVTEQRQERSHPTPQCGLLIEEGLKPSDYTLDDGNSARTYYLAE